jgi:hypothetical protein
MNRALKAKLLKLKHQRREAATQHSLGVMGDHLSETKACYAANAASLLAISNVQVNSTVPKGTRVYRHRLLFGQSDIGRSIEQERKTREWDKIVAEIKNAYPQEITSKTSIEKVYTEYTLKLWVHNVGWRTMPGRTWYQCAMWKSRLESELHAGCEGVPQLMIVGVK